MAMPARFHAARDRALAAVDNVFAELLQVSGFKAGLPDPLRPPIQIEAPLRVGGGDENNLAGGNAQSWRSQIAAGKAQSFIDRAKYPDLLVRKGDRVRAVSRRGQPWWEVARVDDRGETRLVLELTEI